MEADKFTDSRVMKFVSHRCTGADCFDAPAEEITECPAGKRTWSVTKDWDPNTDASKRVANATLVPKAGDSFIIPSDWHMELDLAETPIFDKIEVNGCLSFK